MREEIKLNRKFSRIDADIDRAVISVRRHYGANLMAFFADVQRELLQRSSVGPEKLPPRKPVADGTGRLKPEQ